MKKLFLSFISPCGRIGICGFWWRQLLLTVVLCPASAWMAHTLTWMEWGSWGDFAEVSFSLVQLFPPAFLCILLTGGVETNDVRLTDGWAPDMLSGLHASPALLLSLLLVYLLSWCCFALSLRRLRDIRNGLYLLPLFLPYFWLRMADFGLRLADIRLFEHSGILMALFMISLFMISLLFCLPSQAANQDGR